MAFSARLPHRVSVIVPVYRASYLHDAMASVASQRRPVDELIVIDDGSPDGAAIEEAVKVFGDRALVIHQANQGAGAARNAGLRAATGEVVAFLDADDRWYPHMLSHQLTVLDRTGADVVYADAELAGGSTTPGGRFMDRAPSSGSVTVTSLLSQECTVLMSSVVARRHAIERVGGFDPTMRRGQDFDLWIRMAHAGCRFAYSREVVLTRCIHDGNLSGTQRDELRRAIDVLTKALETLPLDTANRATAERRRGQLRGWLERENGKDHLAGGDIPSAVSCLSRSVQLAPDWKTRTALVALHVAPDLTRRLCRWRYAPATTM